MIFNEHAHETINRQNKAQTSDCKNENNVSINKFSKVIESENPNFTAINHYENTVQQRLEDLEERTYEAIDETSEEQETERMDLQFQFHLQVDELSQKSMHISETHVNIAPTAPTQTMTAK